MRFGACLRAKGEAQRSPPEREFARQVALVTGAAGGIGPAVCRRLAQDGAHIVATDIDLAGAEPLAAAGVPAPVGARWASDGLRDAADGC